MLIKSNYVSPLSFATIDSKKTFELMKEKTGKAIIDELTAAKLRGCGGAGFPTGFKLALMAKEAAPKYVICNADEGEPGTFKDREILTNHADLVFTGMAIASLAIGGAKKGIFYLRKEYEFMHEHLLQAIKRCFNFTNFLIEIRSGAGAYVCGEETALIESLEGKRGEPRNRPPFPIQKGFNGFPSAVNNVETFAWITTIMHQGATWFSKVGTEKSTGYKIFSISGDCKKPGIYEFPFGITISEMLAKVGADKPQAVQMGGASGQTIFPEQFKRKIAFEDAPPGGSIMIFGSERNMLDVAENFLEFFVEESCGQCTPCRKGNKVLQEKLLKFKSLLQGGQGLTNERMQEYLIPIKSLTETMKIASKCGLGQASPNAFLAIINHLCSCHRA